DRRLSVAFQRAQSPTASLGARRLADVAVAVPAGTGFPRPNSAESDIADLAMEDSRQPAPQPLLSQPAADAVGIVVRVAWRARLLDLGRRFRAVSAGLLRASVFSRRQVTGDSLFCLAEFARTSWARGLGARDGCELCQWTCHRALRLDFPAPSGAALDG